MELSSAMILAIIKKYLDADTTAEERVKALEILRPYGSRIESLATHNDIAAQFLQTVSNSSTVIGNNPSTYSPTATPEGKKNYLPWIIGGAAALGVLLILFKNNKKGR